MERSIAHPGVNSLLANLSPEQRHRFESRSESVTLEVGRVVSDSEQPIHEIYFPVSAVVSVLSVMTNRTAVEAAVIGHEGIAPLAAFHHVPTAAEQVVVQIPGKALRMPREDFHAALSETAEMRGQLHRFSQALFTFASQTSGCNRLHSVVQRCARWLLLTHDRVPEDDFPLTQLFLSQMLGVRRSSVTVAAEALRTAGAIDYTRGRIRIISRDVLYRHSCDCYDIIRSTYDRLLLGRETPSPLASLKLTDGGHQSLASSAEDEADAVEEMRLAMDLQQKLWRARLDGLPDAFVETDRDDNIIEVNRVAEALIGESREELLGKPLASLFQNTDLKGLRDVMGQVKAEGGTAHWIGTLATTRIKHAVEVMAAVNATRDDPPGASVLASKQRFERYERYAGARWLLRPKRLDRSHGSA